MPPIREPQPTDPQTQQQQSVLPPMPALAQPVPAQPDATQRANRTPMRTAVPARAVNMAPSMARGDSAAPLVNGNYDVVLDVPNVSVDEIVLDVDGVNAHVALDAKVAKLVEISAGADVGIQRVYLGIRGVQAEAHLMVDLDNVTAIVSRVLTTLDNNPEIITGLYNTLNNTVSTVGNVANTALQPNGVVSQAVNTVGQVANTALQPNGVVSQAVNTVGNVANTALQPGGVASQLVETVGGTLNNLTGQGGLLSVTGVNALGNTLVRTVDASGRLIEGTLDGTGKLVSQTGIGNVLNLPAISQTVNPATGQILRTVQDVSGALIQVTLDNAGKVLGTTVLNAAGQASNTVGQVGNTVGQIGNTVGKVTNGVAGGRSVAVGNLVGPPFPGEGGAANLVNGVTGSVGGLLGGVQQIVLGSKTNAQGQTVQQIVDAAGSILERVINTASGQIVSTKALGNVLTLPVVKQSQLSNGSIVRTVRDATGSLLEITLSPNGLLQMVKPLTAGATKTAGDVARTATDAVAPVAGAVAPATSALTGTVNSVAASVYDPAMVLSNTTNEQGQAVQRVVDQLGNITERTLNAAGQMMIRKHSRNARLLPLVRESVDQVGQTIRVVRDTSGTLIQLTFATDGKLTGVKVLH